MGERGPSRIPKHLRAVPGSGPESVADRVAREAPDRPAGFPTEDVELSELWEEVTTSLDDAGLLARCDGMTLELALRHFLAARRAGDALFSGNVVIEDPAHGARAQKKNPAGAEMRAQSALFLEYAKQLGMTFAVRARIPTKDRGDGDDGQPNPVGASGS